MRVLGIDPGVAQTGWAVLESGPPPAAPGGASVLGLAPLRPPPAVPRLVASGLLKTFPRQTLPERLEFLHGSLGELLKRFEPRTLAIEELFFMKAARSVAATSYARAVVLLAASQARCAVTEYNPRTVKASLTGNGNAPKPQMQKMVMTLLSLASPPRPDDVADAMAIGLCHLKHDRFRRAVAAGSTA